MLQSRLFTKTRKDAPKDEVSRNAELLIRGGYIHKEMAGAYSYLPLGLRVIEKIKNIVREEMNALGGQEVLMTALQEKDIWEKSDRWSDDIVDVWFKTQLKNGTEIGLAYTHEAPLTNVMKGNIASYRDLPRYVYQFQTKFRNELRTKSGLFRGREFIMKDLYSFDKSEEDLNEFYEKVADSYKRIFDRAGIGEITHRVKASGGTFSKEGSDEFQTITPAGEDLIYIQADRSAVNKEWFEERGQKPEGTEEKSVEVGNIFKLGTHFSESLGLYFTDESGEKKPVIMGSYGIGIGRLMGTVVEALSDEKGIVWPREIAPFRVHLLLVSEDEKIKALADGLYKTLISRGIETLYDDREARAGEKFADSDLLGIPSRIIVGNKTAESKLYELKDRESGKTEEVSLEHLLEELKR